MSRFAGKSIIVTGGSGGIGREAAVEFAREGASVVIGDILESEGRQAAEAIADAGGRAVFLRADVAREEDCAALVHAAVSNFGGLDIAVNNAGVEQSGRPIIQNTPAEFDRIIRINVLGVLMGMKHQIPAMISRGGGSIVNLSSIAGLVGFPGAPVYVASKHAVLGLTKTAALEHAGDRIRINAVCPGAIQTGMIDRFVHRDTAAKQGLAAAHPLGRFGAASEAAAAILWLASDAASFVTGQWLTVDGGYTAQ